MAPIRVGDGKRAGDWAGLIDALSSSHERTEQALRLYREQVLPLEFITSLLNVSVPEFIEVGPQERRRAQLEEAKVIRIVSWNCNQGLSRKADRLLELEPDVAVVWEAGGETELGDGRLRRVARAGRNETKGLAVFVREGNDAEVDASLDEEREWYLPVRVDIGDGLDVLAVWAMYENSEEPRSEWLRTLSALQHYRPLLSGGRALIIGDFNNKGSSNRTRRPGWRHRFGPT